MLTRAQAFRLSYWSLDLAVITLVGVPAGCAITSRDNVTWDYWQDDILFLSVSAGLIITFLLISFFSGAYALKEYKKAVIWVIPLGLCVIAAICGALWMLTIYIYDPYGI